MPKSDCGASGGGLADREREKGKGERARDRGEAKGEVAVHSCVLRLYLLQIIRTFSRPIRMNN